MTHFSFVIVDGVSAIHLPTLFNMKFTLLFVFIMRFISSVHTQVAKVEELIGVDIDKEDLNRLSIAASDDLDLVSESVGVVVVLDNQSNFVLERGSVDIACGTNINNFSLPFRIEEGGIGTGGFEKEVMH